MSPDTFKSEIEAAVQAFDKFIVCIEKTPEEFRSSLISLLGKAIKAYQDRGPALRHGIALDKHLTVILSQTETERPICGIYFNLHSPYHRPASPKSKARAKTISDSAEG